MPVPLVIVTLFPEIEQAPLAVITAVVLALVLDETVNMELSGALAGAPVKVTVGAILLAVVDWVAVVEV
ncbi:MAG: hypothetical protein ABSG79_08800 [Bryobacteraceae bacterium]